MHIIAYYFYAKLYFNKLHIYDVCLGITMK